MNGVGEIEVIVAEDAKVDAVDAARECFARDRVAESGEGGRGQAVDSRLGEARLVDRADDVRQAVCVPRSVESTIRFMAASEHLQLEPARP